MKKYRIGLFFLLATLLVSCYKDDSTMNYKIINPINIEDTKSTFSLFSLDTLVIKPLIYKEGARDENLSFKWTIHHQLMTPQVVATTMSLKLCMSYPPHASDYSVVLEVTDKDSGVSIEKRYTVTVLSPFGLGLIVCHSEDGKNSDVSLIRSWNYLSSLKKDTVMSNLFSRINHRKIEGIATGAVSTQYQSFATLTVTTSDAIERVDPRDYTFVDSGDKVFLIKPEKIKPVFIVNDANSGNDILNNDGNVHIRSFQGGNRVYGYKCFLPDMSPTYITKICKPYWFVPMGFDQLGGRFVAINASSQRFDTQKVDPTDIFNWNDFKDYECLSIVFGTEDCLLAIMKHKTTNEIEVCGFKGDYSSTGIRAKKRFKLSLKDCPDLDKAILFEASERASVIYYATPTAIYVANYITGKIITTKEYEVEPGEELTTMYVWSNYRAGSGKIKYTNPNPNAEQKVLETWSQHRMMVISTYNAAKNEGTIRHIGILNTSTGILEQDRDLHVSYGGFGKISVTQFQQQ